MEINTDIEKYFLKSFEIEYVDKWNKRESGMISFTCHEIMIQSKNESKIKIDKSIAYPEISELIFDDQIHVTIVCRESNNFVKLKIADPIFVYNCVFVAFKLFFPFEDIFGFVKVVNNCANLNLDNARAEVSKLQIVSHSPCNNFTKGMKFYAKYKYLPENEELIWDIDTVYASKKTTLFVMKDFDHLKPKFIYPVLGAMSYNTYFTELSFSNVDISPYDKYLEQTLISNVRFKKLYFVNSKIRIPQLQLMVEGLSRQKHLTLLDLSNNENIGDKGMELLSACWRSQAGNLEHLRLASCGLTSTSLERLGNDFSNQNTGSVAIGGQKFFIKTLDLSRNLIKDGFGKVFLDEFLAKCQDLEDLNLSGMGCPIGTLLPALKQGPMKSLRNIDLSNNIASTNIKNTDWTEFFKCTRMLNKVNLSNFKFYEDSISEGLIGGLLSNMNLQNGIELSVSNSGVNGNNLSKTMSRFKGMYNITELDLSSNNLGMDFHSVIDILPDIFLKALNISNNFLQLRPKDLQLLLKGLSNALQSPSSALEDLNMSGCNLGENVAILISDMDCYMSLRHLDLSSNQIGSIAARTIGRMLTIDKHLREISLDNNNITKEIYEEIIDGLQHNFTLTTFHVPYMDLARYNSKLIGPIIAKINKHQKKMHKIYQGASADDIRSLALDYIQNRSTETLERCTLSLQEVLNRLISKHSTCSKESEDSSSVQEIIDRSKAAIHHLALSRDLQFKLNAVVNTSPHQVAESKSCEETVSRRLSLDQIITNTKSCLSISIQSYMKRVLNAMLNEAQINLPMLFENEPDLEKKVREECEGKIRISEEYLQQLFDRFIKLNLEKKILESHLCMSTNICDVITEAMITTSNDCERQADRCLNAKHATSAKEESVQSKDTVEPTTIDESLDLSVTSSESIAALCSMPLKLRSESKGERKKSVKSMYRKSLFSAAKSRPYSLAFKKFSSDDEQNVEEVHHVAINSYLDTDVGASNGELPATSPEITNGTLQHSTDSSLNSCDTKATDLEVDTEPINLPQISRNKPFIGIKPTFVPAPAPKYTTASSIPVTSSIASPSTPVTSSIASPSTPTTVSSSNESPQKAGKLIMPKIDLNKVLQDTQQTNKPSPLKIQQSKESGVSGDDMDSVATPISAVLKTRARPDRRNKPTMVNPCTGAHQNQTTPTSGGAANELDTKFYQTPAADVSATTGEVKSAKKSFFWNIKKKPTDKKIDFDHLGNEVESEDED